MTREEAIERMKIIKGDCYIIDNPEDKEAFDMAIQALSQEPISLNDINNALEASFRNGVRSAKVEQEPCDDAISRQAVLDGLKGCMCEDWVKTLFATMVKQLPSVTQKSETETWNGMHGQITAPKGTFKKIWEDAESEDKG